MSADMDCRLTASFLESGQALVNTGHAAAVIAGLGVVATHSAAVRLLFCGSMVCWVTECWFAVRVTIDASLFRHLACEPEDAWQRLDELRSEWGFRIARETRSAVDRQRGAIALWRRQAKALAVQVTILIAAIAFQA
jgi:hypothetical protein